MTQAALFPDDNVTVTGGATISPCGLYRYRLWRVWDSGLRPMAFVMLNPSTATATEDDATIRRCVGFARREGCGGIVVVNLFAYRATNPRELRGLSFDPAGEGNDLHVREVAEQSHPVVAAWGCNGAFRGRDRAVKRILAAVGVQVWSLGPLTKDGHPRHPLYLPADEPLVPFDCA